MRLLFPQVLFGLGVSATCGLRHLAVESRRGGGCRGCRCGRATSVGNLRHSHRPHLVQRLLGGRVPFSYGQLVGSPRVAVRTAPLALIEVPVVKRREDHALLYTADAGLRLEPSARRLDAHHVTLPHTEAPGVRGREFDPDVRRRALELRSAGGLGAGVEVVDRTAGCIGEGVLLPGLLVRRLVLSSEQERTPGGRKRLVLHLRTLRARQEVAAVGLAVVRLCVEVAVDVEALCALGILVGARPLDAAAIPELVVGNTCIVAGASPRALLPSFEGRLEVVPLYQGLPVFVPEIHAPGVVQEDVEVALGLAGGSTAFSERCTVRSAFVKVPVFSPQVAAGNTTSAYCAVSVRKMSWTTTKRSSFSRIERMRESSGRETAGLVALIQSKEIEPCSA